MSEPWLTMLGLCRRAGKLKSGEDMVYQAIMNGEAHLVIIAEDASPNTRKRFTDKCHTYNTAYVYAGRIRTLGSAIGKGHRAVCAVTDEGMAKALRERINQWQRSE